jgi:hypothetical protein
MAKIGSPTKRPTSKGGFCGDPEEAAPQLVTNRERRNKSGPLVAATVRVKFMELRPSMCRWPIGDPKHIETFRFCGSACSSGAIYCRAHTAKAHAPNRPRTPRTTNFCFNTQLESRDSIGSVARDLDRREHTEPADNEDRARG